MIEVSPKGCLIEGVNYPPVGFGTYKLQGDVCYEAVAEAFELGYRIVDTATYYENFEPISRALKKFGRKNFYLISKVWPDSHTRPLLQKDLEMSLQKLQTTYLDAYFLHWPNSAVPIEETLSTLDEMRQKKLIRHIGLSNVTCNHLKRALECGVSIAWVQVEFSPFFYDEELLGFCKKQGVAVQAWSPLGRGRTEEDANLVALGKKYRKTPSQVALRWILQEGSLSLPSSHTHQHMAENFNILDFHLAEAEMKGISDKAKAGSRYRISFDEFDFPYEKCWPKN